MGFQQAAAGRRVHIQPARLSPFSVRRRGKRKAALVFRFPAKTETGIEIQYGFVGKQIEAVEALLPVPEDFFNQIAGKPLVAVSRMGHDCAQLDIVFYLPFQRVFIRLTDTFAAAVPPSIRV